MNRRSFMGSILALGAAPAIVRADSLMRIVPLDTKVLWGPSIVASELIVEAQLVKNAVYDYITFRRWMPYWPTNGAQKSFDLIVPVVRDEPFESVSRRAIAEIERLTCAASLFKVRG